MGVNIPLGPRTFTFVPLRPVDRFPLNLLHDNTDLSIVSPLFTRKLFVDEDVDSPNVTGLRLTKRTDLVSLFDLLNNLPSFLNDSVTLDLHRFGDLFLLRPLYSLNNVDEYGTLIYN